MMTFSSEEFKTLEITPSNYRGYLDSLLALRKRMSAKGRYTPFLYFRDLKQLRMYERYYRDSLNATPSGRFDLVDNNFRTNELCNISLDQWRGSRIAPSDRDIEKARDFWFPNGKKTGNPSSEITAGSVLAVFGVWFLWFYLRGLPFALILFLIWKFRMKKEFNEGFRWEKMRPEMHFGAAPLSFLLSLLLWPVVLAIDLRNKLSDAVRRVDVIATRGTMLTLFSKQEERLIELGRSMTRKEFMRHLEGIGLVRRHSFAAALLVAILLVLVPGTARTSTRVPVQKQAKAVFAKHVIDRDVGTFPVRELRTEAEICPPSLAVTDRTSEALSFFIRERWRVLEGFSSDIGGVPKISFNFRKALIC